jgi:ribonuclease-3
MKRAARDLGIERLDPSLSECLAAALRHSSCQSEGSLPNNQRLEFLGDSVLGLVVSHMLYVQLGNENEGILTDVRRRLVDNGACRRYAQDLKLELYLEFGKGFGNGSSAKTKKAKAKAFGDAFEAVLGVVFLNGGLAQCVEWFLKKCRKSFVPLLKNHNWKGRLQEILLQHGENYPEYCLVEGSSFKTEISFVWKGETWKQKGGGNSKKESESQAAKNVVVWLSPRENLYSRLEDIADCLLSTQSRDLLDLSSRRHLEELPLYKKKAATLEASLTGNERTHRERIKRLQESIYNKEAELTRRNREVRQHLEELTLCKKKAATLEGNERTHRERIKRLQESIYNKEAELIRRNREVRMLRDQREEALAAYKQEVTFRESEIHRLESDIHVRNRSWVVGLNWRKVGTSWLLLFAIIYVLQLVLPPPPQGPRW